MRQRTNKMSWGVQFLAQAVATVVAVASLALVTENTASAAPAPPVTDASFYVLYPYNGTPGIDTSSTAYGLGCNQGRYDAAHNNSNSELVLDFGAQNSSNNGTYLPKTNTPVSYSNVEYYAENFADAYYVCAGADTVSVLDLGIGTNNSVPSNVDYNHGSSWANVVGAVLSWATANSITSQVSIRGADDIEPAFAPQANSINWANGYNATYPAPYVNYGSCDGCPTSASTGQGLTFYPCSGCSAWNQYGIWEVSWGENSALALPEIYVYNQQGQWAAIAYYGEIAQTGPVYYEGALDEYDLNTSTYTPNESWTNFWNALQGYGGSVAQTPRFSSQIHDTAT